MNDMQTDVSYKNVLLVFTSNGSHTLRKAFQITDAHHGRLTIIDVIDDLESYRGLLPPSLTESDMKKAFAAERKTNIEIQVKQSGLSPEALDIRIRFGKAAVEIIREAIASKHDMVIKTAIGGQTMSDRLFGTTAKKLLRKCPCPVWIAKPDKVITFKRILAAIDPMPASHRSDELNRRILTAAAQMARIDDGHLDILHCWHLPGETILSHGRTKISSEEFKRIRDIAENVHRQKTAQLVDEMTLSPIAYQVHVIHGTPTETILNFAQRQRSDLIVIGSVGLSGLSGMLMGSTAESIADKARTSVLAIKPEAFISPITVVD